MNAYPGYSEIVWIKDDFRLVDAESYERIYTTADGRPLATGYYVARWPAGTANPHFLHERLTFDGPYESRRSALAALERQAGLDVQGIQRQAGSPSSRSRSAGA